jgi:hypothetical protein
VQPGAAGDRGARADDRAATALNGLASKLASATKPAAVQDLNSQISTAQTAGMNAATGATGYARLANAVLEEFRGAESRYAQVLSGATLTPGGRPAPGGPWVPFASAGSPGPGFGVPTAVAGVVPGVLPSLYGGTIPVGNPWSSPIPGYGVYKDATTPEAVPDGIITDGAMLAASFFAAGPLGDLGAGALRSLGEALGIGGAGSAAMTAAGRTAYAERVLGALETGETRSSSLAAVMREGAGDRAAAEIQIEINQAQVRAKGLETLVNVAGKRLPVGVPQIITELANRGWMYANWTVAKLVSAQSALIKIGTPTALAAGQVIGIILKVVGR